MTWLNLTPAAAAAAIERWVAERGDPPYRARQLLPCLWQRPVRSWADATDLPRGLAADLDRAQPLRVPVLEIERRARDGTRKFLWRFDDGAAIESVMIPEGRRRRTLCISSQAGCAYGCVFCATGRMGFGRHLAPWEITSQVRELALRPDVPAPTNIVFMGMGEPLHNWSAVDVALSVLNDTRGFGIGARHITVSTIGLVPGLRKLAMRPEQFRVALSLHAARSDRRRALMPIEGKYPLDEVLSELAAFPRRVTFEYVCIREANDSDADAEALASCARGLRAHVNLLPLHPGGAPHLQPTPPARVRDFAAVLRARGVNVTVRQSRGLDIEAACGQLRTVSEAGRVGTQ